MSTPARAGLAVRIRPATPEDAPAAGQICYDAFRAISAQHNFPPDFPSAQTAIGLLGALFSHPGFYTIVAESAGRVIGSNCLDERSPIAGVGPITVDPSVQNSGAGRLLMEAVLNRARERGFPGVRLLQSAYHSRSLSLYAKLGFDAREPMSVMQGSARGALAEGYAVRAASESDLDAAHRLCEQVHGHTRAGELRDALAHGLLRIVEHRGRLTGYTSGVGFFGHSVGETNADVQALIASTETFGGPGLIVPTRNSELFRWCLHHGLRVVQPLTLMSVGLYNEPKGAYLPSILY
jgi:predicted N-acetyltransferase YhbS